MVPKTDEGNASEVAETAFPADELELAGTAEELALVGIADELELVGRADAVPVPIDEKAKLGSEYGRMQDCWLAGIAVMEKFSDFAMITLLFTQVRIRANRQDWIEFERQRTHDEFLASKRKLLSERLKGWLVSCSVNHNQEEELYKLDGGPFPFPSSVVVFVAIQTSTSPRIVSTSCSN